MNWLAMLGVLTLLVMDIPKFWDKQWDQKINTVLGRLRYFVTPIAIFLLFIGSFIAYHDERTLRLEAEGIKNRANILVYPGTVYNSDGSNAIEAHFLFGNAGNSPARKVRWEVWAEIIADSKPVLYCEDLGQPKISDGPRDIAQNEKIGRFVKRPWANNEVEEVRKNEKHIYLCGRVSYIDEFNKKHNTSFCFRYSGSRTVQIPVPDGLAWGWTSQEYKTCPKFVDVTR